MASNLEEQRKQLDKLAKLKQQLAKVDLASQSAQAQKLQKSINGVVESLTKLGIAQDRIDAYYDAFVRANAAINNVSDSISKNLLKNINALNTAIESGAGNFIEPIENLKAGAKNVTDLLQTAYRTSANLETIALEKRRENTRYFAEQSIKLTGDLTKAYDALLKNEKTIGTEKFQNLNVEKEIANTLVFVSDLDKMKMQLGQGYYANLRLQANTVLEMLEDIKVSHKVNAANNELAKDAIQNKKQELEEQKQLNKELDKYNVKRAVFDAKQERAGITRTFMQLPSNKELADADKEVQSWLEEQRRTKVVIANDLTQQMLDDFNEAQAKLDAKRIASTEKNELRSRAAAIQAGLDAQKAADEYLAELKRKEDADKDAADKRQALQAQLDADLEMRTKKRLLKQRLLEVEEEEKKQNELRKIQEKAQREQERADEKTRNAYSGFMDKLISKLPGGSILSILGKMGAGAQLLAVLVGSILYLILKWDNAVSKFAEKLSIARAQADATLRSAGALASKLGLANIYMEQMAEGIAKAQEGLGGMDISARFLAGNEFVERMIAGSTVLSDTFGLGASEIAGMVDASTAMGVSLSSNAIMVTTMSKGIMSANKAMQALSNLSPKLLTGFKGTNAQLISMVTKMKLLGVEANNIVSSNDKLLDLESSISNAFEAQVATGAQINIDRLMALQMSGKYSDVLDEQLKTLQQSDYLNKGPLAQELIAQGLGLDREVASQMMLRKILADKVGLTDEVLRQRQKEGKLAEDEISLAEKQGRISKLEADRMREITKEYDSKTIQEKFIRALDNFTTSLSSTLQPLIDVLRGIIGGLGSASQTISGGLYGLGGIGQVIMSLIGGVAMVGAVGMLGKNAITKGKDIARVIKGGTQSAKAGTVAAAATSATSAAGSGSAMAGGAAGGAFKGILKKGLKLGALTTALDFGLNLSQGQSASEAGGRALLSGGLGYLGGALGALVPVPGLNLATAAAGGVGGSMLGSYIGDLIYGKGPSEMSSADAQFLQSQIGNASTAATVNQTTAAADANTVASELISTMKAVSSKLDTSNTLLSSINNKPTEVSVNLDGEKVGKAVISYSSAAMDRNRIIGNTYGGNRDSYSNRTPR